MFVLELQSVGTFKRPDESREFELLNFEQIKNANNCDPKLQLGRFFSKIHKFYNYYGREL